MTTTFQQNLDAENAEILRIVKKMLADGYSIRVFDGEGWAENSEHGPITDQSRIMADIGHSDETRLVVYQGAGWPRIGWVQLIHGNGADVVADYTTNLSI